MTSYFDTIDGGDDDDDNKRLGSDDDDKSETLSVVSDEQLDIIDKEEDDNVDLPLDDEDDDYEEEEEDEEDDEEEEEDDDEDMKGGAGDEDEADGGEIELEANTKSKRVKKIPSKTVYKKTDIVSEDEDEDEDDDGEMYLQKFERSVNSNYVVDNHPESVLQNYDEILAMVKVIRDKNGIIIDDLHRTIPYLTKYERARILGQRAKQINAGSQPFIKVPENVIDGYIIAELELREKRIPFIIRRPLPNGGSEYWSIRDLENIAF